MADIASLVYRSTIRHLFFWGRKAASAEERLRLINLMNSVICENQGRLSEYSYIASEFHKEIKNNINSNNKGYVLRKVLKLEKYLYTEFNSICDINYKFIQEYFKERAYIPPRICIKLAQGNYIVDPGIRDKPLYTTPKHLIEENTGFHHVDISGKHYLCNNIPKAAKVNNYINPRLNDNLVKSYNEPNLLRIKYWFNQDYVDQYWCDCWTDIAIDDSESIRTPTDSCYKSTLIVPMTLIGNRLSDEFKKKFDIKQFHEKAIFGFLCLDHQQKNYFEDEDIKFGYIFADLLSLYLITQQIYIDKSKTIAKARKLTTRGVK